MNSVHAAFTGRIGKDAEVGTARDGKPWASFPVAVDAKTDGEAQRRGCGWRCSADAVGAAPRLTKETEVYCEGRLSLWTWTGRDGEPKARLNLAAWGYNPWGKLGGGNPRYNHVMNTAGCRSTIR